MIWLINYYGIKVNISTIIRILESFILIFNMCNSNDFNREQCMKNWDTWLIPELQRAWDIYTEKEELYQEEKEKLDETYHEN